MAADGHGTVGSAFLFFNVVPSVCRPQLVERVLGLTAAKASLKVTAADTLDADLGDDYVSRGAYKLVGLLASLSSISLPTFLPSAKS